MDNKEVATRISDIERVIGKYDSPVLGNHFRATLPSGKAVRLLISLQGQGRVNKAQLYSMAHSEVGLSSYELENSYFPLFQDWGFITIANDYIDENIKSRDAVLSRVGQWWRDLNPHNVEKLSVDLFDMAARRPQSGDKIQTLLDQYTSDDYKSSFSHLSNSGLVDLFTFKDIKWYYSPEIFGQDYDKAIKYLSTADEKQLTEINSLIDEVNKEQGVPIDLLIKKHGSKLLEQVPGVGLLYGYGLEIGTNHSTFMFTPDLRSRFEQEGRGDKFEIIKPGVAHFQFANKLANPATGKLNLNPAVIINRLIERGFAGDATAIGTDYELLVKKGIVKVEPTSGSRYKFVLPESREKIADLEAIRDAFEAQQIIPNVDFSSFGLKGKLESTDSLVYRSRRAIKEKELLAQFCQEMYHL